MNEDLVSLYTAGVTFTFPAESIDDADAELEQFLDGIEELGWTVESADLEESITIDE
jgi:hypothetical protein